MREVRLQAVRGVALDVDGVLTDGGVFVGREGNEFKRFSVLDGPAVHWCRGLGIELAIVSGRASPATTARAAELGIDTVYQGVRDKAAQVSAWAADVGLELDEVMYVGDDHIDLPVFDIVGVCVAPANAEPEVRERADHVTRRSGGDGALREAVEWLLNGTGRLEEAVDRYRAGLRGDQRK